MADIRMMEEVSCRRAILLVGAVVVGRDHCRSGLRMRVRSRDARRKEVRKDREKLALGPFYRTCRSHRNNLPRESEPVLICKVLNGLLYIIRKTPNY